MAPRLRIPITADGSQARREVDQTTRSFSGMQSKITANLRNIAAGFGLAFGGAALVGGVKESINAASDLNETVSKVGQVFGTAGDDVIAWSKNSSNAIGQSQRAALDAASSFAVFGKSAGLSGGDLTKFSTGLTGLSADFASFSNTSPEEAVQAIGAALRGETEPIRKYGLVLDQGSIQAEAFRLGLTKAAKAPVTPAARIQATQSLIKTFADGQKITGDFARTSGGLANQQRILSAKVDNAKAAIGAGLVPIVLGAIGTFSSFASGIGTVVGWVQRNSDVLGPLVAAFAAITLVMTGASIATGIYNGVMIVARTVQANAAVAAFLLNNALRANPLILITTLVIALVAAIIIAYQRSETFRAVVQAVWGAVRGAVTAAVSAIIGAVRSMVAFIGTVAGTVRRYMLPIAAIMLAPFTISYLTIRLAIEGIKRIFPTIAGAVRSAVGGIAGILAAPFRAGADAIRAAIGGVVDWVSGKIAGIRNTVSSGLDFVRGLYNPFARTWNSIQITLPKVKIPLGPTLGGGTIGLPNIPELRRGGYVTRATLALIGEGSSPEVVAPEPMLRQIIRAELGGRAGGDTYNITVTGALDPDAVARQIDSLLTRRARRVGGIQLAGVHR